MHSLPLHFTDEQRIAAASLDRAMALLAAAGSGKTTVLVHRYLGLLARGRKPNEILTVTFTNEAANQLRARIAAQLESETLKKAVETTGNIATIHGFCYGLLDSYGSIIGLPPIRGILSSFELANGFESAYVSWLEALDPRALRGLLASFNHGELKEMVRAIFKERFVYRAAPSEGEILVRLRELVSPLLTMLENDFNTRGLYSFDDLENLALRILDESPATAQRLRGELKHILVDEFQDTSRLQWEILKHLIGDEPDKLFVVGDPKQSIYSFRHADVKLFLDVTKQIERRGGVIHELSANFRSEPRLLETINRISGSFFSGSEVPFALMQPGRPPTAEKPPLRICRYAAGEEIQQTVAAVGDLLATGEPPESLAILFRNSDRIANYFHALVDAGIPARCKRTTRLFQCYDVLDLGNYLRVIENPLNTHALSAFLRSPYVGFNERRLMETVDRPGANLFEKLGGTPELAWFFALIESGEFGVLPALEALFQNSAYFPRQTEAFLEWLSPLAEKNWSVAEAVARLAAWEKEDTLFGTEEGGAGVQLMTVHGAKGLEYPHVFLVDNLRKMPTRTPPLRIHPEHAIGLRYRIDGEAMTTPEYDQLAERQKILDLEESKRILYVALTRAEETLTLFLPDETQVVPRGTWGAMLEEGLKSGSGSTTTPPPPEHYNENIHEIPRPQSDRLVPPPLR